RARRSTTPAPRGRARTPPTDARSARQGAGSRRRRAGCPVWSGGRAAPSSRARLGSACCQVDVEPTAGVPGFGDTPAAVRGDRPGIWRDDDARSRGSHRSASIDPQPTITAFQAEPIPGPPPIRELAQRRPPEAGLQLSLEAQERLDDRRTDLVGVLGYDHRRTEPA